MKSKRRLVTKILIVSGVAIIGMFLLSMTSQPPDNLGVRNGKLAELPASSNCVSTQTSDPDKLLAAISFSGDASTAMTKIKQIVQQMPRAKIIAESADYLRLEFTSAIFRFVDDVEFLIDDNAKLIHFRSASRVGYSDLGANRKRMTKITQAFDRTELNQE